MEPSASIFETTIYPTAIITPDVDLHGDSKPGSWISSELNPKNRVDLLSPDDDPSFTSGGVATPKPRTYRWRIDGCEADGVRFFAIPDFALERAPLRIDTYIPDQRAHGSQIQRALKPVAAMLTDSPREIAGLEISLHLVRALQHWSSG